MLRLKISTIILYLSGKLLPFNGRPYYTLNKHQNFVYHKPKVHYRLWKMRNFICELLDNIGWKIYGTQR